MRWFKISFITFLILTVIFSNLPAQEEGEMLYFNSTPNLDFTITENLMRSIEDSVLYESQVSTKSREPFNRILFNGNLSDTNMILQVNFETQNSQWSDWQNTYMKIFNNGRFWARLDLDTILTQRIKYRFLNRGVKPPARIEIYAVEGINKKTEDQGFNEPLDMPQKTEYILIDTIPKPPVITREEWGANPPIGNYVPHNPYRLTQHHTAGTRVSTLQQGIDEMEFIQDFHQNGRGWQDIGYHYCIDDSGIIYEGVPPQYRGTHVGGNNTGNIGISYMGNFHIAGEFPTQAALDSLVRIWSWLSFEFGVNPDSLFGHRDYNATACPGDNLYPELPDLRNSIRQALGFGAPYVANPFPQPFTTEISQDTYIQFFIRDESEGVDINSIIVRVNGDTIYPVITGVPNEFEVSYQPVDLFPYSQTVIVAVKAADLADPPNVMQYLYQFKIQVEALYVEVQTPPSMRNATLEISGNWEAYNDDVTLTGLTNGQRLVVIDNDSSHLARIYPIVTKTGDYDILLASMNNFLGESARYRFVSGDGRVHPHLTEYNDVYFQKWGLLSPSPVHFQQDSASSGFIELSGLSDIETRMVIDAFRLEKVDKLDPPEAPMLKWVKLLNPSTNEIEIAWYPTLEGDIAGYRLFMSEDGLTWDQPIVDENTLGANSNSYQLLYNNASTTVYFRVVAVDTNSFINENGNEEPLLSHPSDAYGVGLNGSTKILIVDNFDRMASWTLPYHPFVSNHGEALTAHGHGFDSCTETAVQNGDINLTDYDVVIYFCGDDSRADESIAAADQQRLLKYLEAGGKLFITGSEIGYDFAATTATELERYHYLFKAIYAGDLSGSNQIIGVAGTIFEGLAFTYGTMNGPNLYIEDYPDYLQTFGGSQSALIYANLRIAGIAFTGTYGTSAATAQLVYLGFPFETIITSEDRSALMGRVLTYFGLPTGIEDNSPPLAGKFELFQNYPNPFNPTTKITYTLPQNQTNSKVKLEIFNSLGQKLKTLVDKNQIAGSYEVLWDGRNNEGLLVASGVYYCRLKTTNFVAARKMILLK